MRLLPMLLLSQSEKAAWYWLGDFGGTLDSKKIL